MKLYQFKPFLIDQQSTEVDAVQTTGIQYVVTRELGVNTQLKMGYLMKTQITTLTTERSGYRYRFCEL